MPPPVTFNEKVRYRMLADRRPLLTTFADKLAARAYVEARVGPEVLTELYAATSSPATLLEADLPREFVVKPTHASGAVVLVADFAPSDRDLPEPVEKWTKAMVRPDRLSRQRLVETCESWLARPFRRREWAYRNIPRRILVEELLREGDGVPFDYKFFVFHGRVRLVQVDQSRFERHVRTLFTPEWELLDVEYGHERGADIERPATLAEMTSIAETLGAETDFVRDDLYSLGSRVVFGELTNYPMAGEGAFDPEEFDRWLGDWWTVPKLAR